jgi:ATP-dependent Clp protease ATP-binding subunit ClpA
VFERFTERARQVVVLAQDESRTLKHNYIGTEHLLLGLLREEEGLAARVLESLDITVEEVRAQVERVVGHGDEVTTGQIPFTPRAKKVLELSLREAMALKHNYIGTEHILLGLVRENEGVAARILLDFDADAETIRNQTIGMLSGPGRRAPDEERLRAEIERVREEKAEATEAKEYEKAARLGEIERNLRAELVGEPRPSPRRPSTPAGYFAHPMQQVPLLPGWLLFAVSLGIGVLVGWAIWGL